MEKAEKLKAKFESSFDFKIGRVWDKPVGPHPIGSCQVTVPVGEFEKTLIWVLENRGGIDFFIHPVTGNDLEDHTTSSIWVGKSYTVKSEMFA
ncbi:MAG: aromatic ring-cleaving dioxygenase [Thermoproteota archaeon]